ncbi:MAG: MHYT domain-containing protein [Paracoccaceae bacterium]
MLDVTHNPWLVAASLVVALIAGFTGLSMTRGLSQMSLARRKLSIGLASIALGGGIWSMHFVAMLGLQMPILFYYDAAITLASALVAILVVGLSLLILHFFPRTPLVLTGAGCLVGLGVMAMHYIGMAGLELCRALYTPAGVIVAGVSSCVLNSIAFTIAYSRRTGRNILLGTVCFGLAVFMVHFVAIYGTAFEAIPETRQVGPRLSNEVLAMIVVLTSFALCGAFLFSSVTVLAPEQKHANIPSEVPDVARSLVEPSMQQIPYEKDGQTLFIDVSEVAAVRAEGHYTHLYTNAGQRFCIWSMTEAEKRLKGTVFVKTHRSYLINPTLVASFERKKDNGVCRFDLADLPPVPVSRSRLKDVRAALGV